MKSIITSILLLASIAGFSAEYNLSGTWVGKRYQYDAAKKSYIQEYTYMYEIKQEGSTISGTTYIKNADGKFAEIAVRGYVLENKLFFEEYTVLRAERPVGKIWCLKKGELLLSKEKEEWVLSGATNSFNEINGMPCTGGVTYIKKVDNGEVENNVNPSQKELKSIDERASELNITAFPNPFVDKATIQFSLPEKSTVKAEVFSLDGKKITDLTNETMNAGTHQITFDAYKHHAFNGLFIVRLEINGSVYSKSIVQVY